MSRGNQQTSSQPLLTFREFIEPAWQIVEPSTPFVGGYHVDAIAQHLQAISNGQLQNLIINIPPRHTKSTFVGVLWPAWEWTVNPWLQWLCASYREALAIRDGVKMRRLILSPWYQEQWGGLYRLTGDQNEKRRFENDRAGYRVSIGVGTGTGEGGHRLVLDDPLSAEQADSDAYREAANDWVDSTFSTRGNDPRTVARVIVMQRLHEQDTTGRMIEKMEQGGAQFDHLILPAEYEPTVQICLAGLGEHDIRTEPGQALSPERYGPEQLEQLKIDLGTPQRVAGQLQQRPAPAGGNVFQRSWWDGRNRYDASDEAFGHKTVGRWLFIDTAYKDKETSDYTACSVMELLPDYRLVWREVWNERLTFPYLLPRIEATALAANGDRKLQGVIIEDKGSGTTAVQSLKFSSPPWLAELIQPFQPTGSKVYRAQQASLWCARDCLLIPEPSDAVPWLHGATEQLFRFPTAAHDDICLVAGTQIATPFGDVPIESIRVGESVLTPLGPKRVSSTGMTGISPVIERHGVSGTASHPMFVHGDGFTKMDIISMEQTIDRLSLRGLLQWSLSTRGIGQKPSFFKASPTGSWGRAAITSASRQRMQEGGALRVFTSRFGKLTTARKFREASTFTIATATSSITTLATWSAYRLANIMRSLGRRLTRSDNANTLSESGRLHPSGTAQKMAGHGIGRMVAGLTRNGSGSLSPVLAAVRPSRPIAGNTALLDAPSGTRQSAKDAAGPDVAVPVFNLKVEDAGCYYANGVLVSNCDTVSMGLIFLEHLIAEGHRARMGYAA